MYSLKVVVFSRGAGNQQYGLGVDAKIIDQTLREMNASGKTRVTISHKDPFMFVGKDVPEKSDVHIYLEMPCKVAYPWAKVNITIPNPEWWPKTDWAWVLNEPSTVLFHKSRHSKTLFGNIGHYISWRLPALENPITMNKKRQVIYVVGGSINKMAAVNIIVSSWKPEYPPLIIVSSVSGLEKDNVTWLTGYKTKEELSNLQNESLFHCVASLAEGFGYTMAECLGSGSLPLWTDIPVYSEFWGSILGSTGKIETVKEEDNNMMDNTITFTEEAVCSAVQNLIQTDFIGEKLRCAVSGLSRPFRTEFTNAWRLVERLLKKTEPLWTPPKKLENADLPVLGVVTLVHNRPEWFPHAIRNIQATDYPFDKLVWVIVDDSNGGDRVDTKLDTIRVGLPDLKVQYVSIAKKIPIGEKRNRGCAAAILAKPDVEVFAFMDDDDHYPHDSLNIRVNWLKSSNKDVVYCSTLLMYDIRRYISAVNVPPLNLAPCKRISEATLCFKRNFWEAGKFPKQVNCAEGEEFLKGREGLSVEIPPEGVIVSFLHAKNSTSRNIPKQKEANGCHYGFSDDYFNMINQIVAYGQR